MALESEVVFVERVTKLGLADIWPKFQARGWKSMGEFAFAANYAPGQADDSVFITEIVAPLTADPKSAKIAALRRLLFECYSAFASDMAQRTNRTEEDEKP